MNKHSDIDRVLQVWMADGPAAIPDRVVDVVAARIGVQRQRRAWPFQRRTIVTPLKLVAGLAAALIIAVVGYSLLARQSGVGGPPPTPVPSVTPSAIPTSTPAATDPVALTEGTLAGGRYRTDLSFIDPSLSVAGDIPAGWIGHPDNAAFTSPGGSNAGVLISFMEVDRLFSDPCHWDLDGTANPGQPGDVEVGPTVADLTTALKANTSYTLSKHVEPTGMGRFQALALELQLPGGDVIRTCDQRPGESTGDYFVFPDGFYAQGPDNRWALYVVDVNGTRVVVLLSYFPGTPAADVEAGEAIVNSFVFTP